MKVFWIDNQTLQSASIQAFCLGHENATVETKTKTKK